VLLVWNARDPEWHSFVDLGRDLRDHTRLLPEILAMEPHTGLILMEDLGSTNLHTAFESKVAPRIGSDDVLTAALSALGEWRAIDINASGHISDRVMNERALLDESAFFARHFISAYCHSSVDNEWHADRSRLALEVSSLDTSCMHRDLHSENIMVKNNGVRFIDFTSTCTGPTEYDLAALLFDPLLRLDVETITHHQRFFRSLHSHRDEESDRRALLICVVQRLMNVLGSHARFVMDRREQRYAPLIPRSLANLRWVLEELGDYPHLLRVAESCCEATTTESDSWWTFTLRRRLADHGALPRLRVGR